jgi:hypothetical protein
MALTAKRITRLRRFPGGTSMAATSDADCTFRLVRAARVGYCGTSGAVMSDGWGSARSLTSA